MILIQYLLYFTSSTVIGIDLGMDTIKVAVGSKNKPVHLVSNLYSHEATPNIFCFIDKSHWAFGEGAVDQCLINPQKCIQNQRMPYNNQVYNEESQLRGYQIVALSLIQVLQNVKDIERIQDEMKVVLAVPPSITYREKSYLYAACAISGINCIRFVTSSYAPIEVYANENKYGNSKHAVIIDIGHGGVRVSGFEFDNYKIGQKFGLYDDSNGGSTIDENLLKFVLNKYGIILSASDDDREREKNRVLLLAKLRKARETLTLTTRSSTFSFLGETVTISRDDLENCCFEVKMSLKKMIDSLKRDYRYLLDSGSVQLIGGCSRIPCLQDYVKHLLPNVKILRSIDSASAVCMGACYLISDEVNSRIKTHEPLVTSDVILKTGGNVYKLFTCQNTESFNPVVRMTNIDSLQLFRIYDKNDNEKEFSRFTINVPYGKFTNTVDVGFTLSYYLMPIADEPMLIEGYNRKSPLSVSREMIGWELSHDEMEHSKLVVNSMIKGINQRLKTEFQLNSIEEYKIHIQNKLKGYGLNCRKLAFAGISNYIDSRYENCMKENSLGCSGDRLNAILSDFKSLVHFILKLDDQDKNYNNNHNGKNEFERNNAINELYDLIYYCKESNVKCYDIEEWIETNLRSASLREIYEKIGTLKERGKNSNSSYDL